MDVLWILVAGVLIDVDHLWIIYKYVRKYGLREGYKQMIVIKKGKEIKRLLFVFHSIEVLIILIILSFYNKIIFLIFLGFLSHIMSDLIFDLIVFKKTTKYFSIIFRKKI